MQKHQTEDAKAAGEDLSGMTRKVCVCGHVRTFLGNETSLILNPIFR